MTSALVHERGARRAWGIPPWRLAFGAVIAGLGLWLSWACLGVGLPGWRADSAQGLTEAAQDRLDAARTPADRAVAADLARRALQRGPLSVAPLRVLGVAAQDSGRMAEARTLMAAAGARSRRDVLTQAWLFDDALTRADPTALYDTADVLLRVEPDIGRIVFPPMVGVARDPAATPLLVRRLALQPAWRSGFLRLLAARGDAGVAFQVLEALKGAPGGVKDEETGYLVRRLIDDGDYPRAYLVWASLLPLSGRTRLGYLYNGDFAAAPGPPPFNWNLAAATDVVAEVAAPPAGPPTRALHVRFAPTGAKPLASQFLLLRPGAYRLSGSLYIDGQADDGQLVWAVACATDEHTRIAEIDQGGAGGVWRRFAADFTVPAGCAAQQLLLSGRAGEGFDPVSAWYANLRLERISGPRGGGA